MKKNIKIFLTFVLILPIILLASCGITQYYTITAGSSEKKFGTVNGGTDVAKAEGTEISLVASELSPIDNPFVCWIKNNNKVVSFDKVYNMTYSSATEGKYTALFQETYINKTRYATITDIQIEGASAGTIEIKYASASSSSNYQTIENLSFVSKTIETDKTNLLYFGGADGINNKVALNFQVKLVAQNVSSSTTYTLNFDKTLVDGTTSENQISFDSEGKCSLVATNSRDITITLTLSKLNLDLYK